MFLVGCFCLFCGVFVVGFINIDFLCIWFVVVECVCALEMALLYCSTYQKELSMRLEDVS